MDVYKLNNVNVNKPLLLLELLEEFAVDLHKVE
jgi:hypothetical protein